MRVSVVAGAAGVAAGGAAVTGLWMLFERNQRPTLEIKSYVESVHGASEGWVHHTEEMMNELHRMPELAATLQQLASAYVDGREAS